MFHFYNYYHSLLLCTITLFYLSTNCVLSVFIKRILELEAADLRARGKAARGKAASCRGKAAYNLVKYYLAFAFKLFYYVLFDL